MAGNLPLDSSYDRTRRVTQGVVGCLVDPVPVSDPRLVGWARSLAKELQLPESVSDVGPELVALLSGCAAGSPSATRASSVSNGMPYANAYAGHQFGSWAGQLGDGRAITLAEVGGSSTLDGAAAGAPTAITPLSPALHEAAARWFEPVPTELGLRHWELQLKGAGDTPYSRGGDGRAVFRSSVREFITSEWMHSVGIPTTRALALLATGDGVVRDMFYDGNPRVEPGSICARAAPSFLRVGSLQHPDSLGDTDLVRQTATFAIEHNFPHLASCLHRLRGGETSVELPEATRAQGAPSELRCEEDVLAAWFAEVAARTARLGALWTGVGFCHGVLNTDNTSLLGLTIDYGPFGFVEHFDPAFVPNNSDRTGRYRFGSQLSMLHWNMGQLATALADLTGPERLLPALQAFPQAGGSALTAVLGRKLGLFGWRGSGETATLLERHLSVWKAQAAAGGGGGQQEQAAATLASAANPANSDDRLCAGLFSLSNEHRIDMTNLFRALCEVDVRAGSEEELLRPLERALMLCKDEAAARAGVGGWLQQYAERVRESVATAGGDAGALFEVRQRAMQAANPTLIPRNYQMHAAAEAAEAGDFAVLQRLCVALSEPLGPAGGPTGGASDVDELLADAALQSAISVVSSSQFREQGSGWPPASPSVGASSALEGRSFLGEEQAAEEEEEEVGGDETERPASIAELQSWQGRTLAECAQPESVHAWAGRLGVSKLSCSS